MIASTRALKKLAPLLLALVLACASVPAGALAEEAVHYTKEGMAEYEKQLSGGEVAAATFNKKIRSLHLTLKDGRHMLVKYAAHEEPKLAAQLQAKRVPVTVLKPAEADKEAKKPVHHKLRYIAGGVVIAIIVIVAIVLLVDRRRKVAME
jgi:hypothetical protein